MCCQYPLVLIRTSRFYFVNVCRTVMMDDHMYVGDHYEHGAALPTQAGDVRQYVSPQAASEPKFVSSHR
ncbi:unnamed protein product [Haemonchus placei]|uniref:Secreted protein n=1 Tax=Haemonchus placei TaxID=6290 RepID=A0A0N4WTA8_HAEPC|nr:unnamed protein product [Haemonchus placei]